MIQILLQIASKSSKSNASSARLPLQVLRSNPDVIKYKEKFYEIWDFLKPDYKSFAMFEAYDEDHKSIYSVNLDQKSQISSVK